MSLEKGLKKLPLKGDLIWSMQIKDKEIVKNGSKTASGAQSPELQDVPANQLPVPASKNKITDESSDSSLDYGSANEDSAPRDDSLIVAFSDINLNTPKTGKGAKPSLNQVFFTPTEDSARRESQNSHGDGQDNNYRNVETLDPAIPISQSEVRRKLKVFNPLTESFETPDISLNVSGLITCEIGEDPLSTPIESDSILLHENYKDLVLNETNVSEYLSPASPKSTPNFTSISDGTKNVSDKIHTESVANELADNCLDTQSDDIIVLTNEDEELSNSFESDHSSVIKTIEEYPNLNFIRNLDNEHDVSLEMVNNKKFVEEHSATEKNSSIVAKERRDSDASIFVIDSEAAFSEDLLIEVSVNLSNDLLKDLVDNVNVTSGESDVSLNKTVNNSSLKCASTELINNKTFDVAEKNLLVDGTLNSTSTVTDFNNKTIDLNFSSTVESDTIIPNYGSTNTQIEVCQVHIDDASETLDISTSLEKINNKTVELNLSCAIENKNLESSDTLIELVHNKTIVKGDKSITVEETLNASNHVDSVDINMKEPDTSSNIENENFIHSVALTEVSFGLNPAIDAENLNEKINLNLSSNNDTTYKPLSVSEAIISSVTSLDVTLPSATLFVDNTNNVNLMQDGPCINKDLAYDVTTNISNTVNDLKDTTIDLKDTTIDLSCSEILKEQNAVLDKTESISAQATETINQTFDLNSTCNIDNNKVAITEVINLTNEEKVFVSHNDRNIEQLGALDVSDTPCAINDKTIDIGSEDQPSVDKAIDNLKITAADIVLANTLDASIPSSVQNEKVVSNETNLASHVIGLTLQEADVLDVTTLVDNNHNSNLIVHHLAKEDILIAEEPSVYGVSPTVDLGSDILKDVPQEKTAIAVKNNIENVQFLAVSNVFNNDLKNKTCELKPKLDEPKVSEIITAQETVLELSSNEDNFEKGETAQKESEVKDEVIDLANQAVILDNDQTANFDNSIDRSAVNIITPVRDNLDTTPVNQNGDKTNDGVTSLIITQSCDVSMECDDCIPKSDQTATSISPISNALDVPVNQINDNFNNVASQLQNQHFVEPMDCDDYAQIIPANLDSAFIQETTSKSSIVIENNIKTAEKIIVPAQESVKESLPILNTEKLNQNIQSITINQDQEEPMDCDTSMVDVEVPVESKLEAPISIFSQNDIAVISPIVISNKSVSLENISKLELEKSVEQTPQDEINPFQTRSKVANTPDRELSVIQGFVAPVEENPFATKSKIANIPDREICTPAVKTPNIPVFHAPVEESPSTPKFDAVKIPDTELNSVKSPEKPILEAVPVEENSFAPKYKVDNTPNVKSLEKPSVQVSAVPIQENPFVSKSKVFNTPDRELGTSTVDLSGKPLVQASVVPIEENPFVSKSKVFNTPDRELSTSSTVESSSKPLVQASAVLIEENPFVSKFKIANTPDRDLGTSTVKFSEKPIAHAPLKLVEENPFATRCKVANTTEESQIIQILPPDSTVCISEEIIRQESLSEFENDILTTVLESPELSDVDSLTISSNIPQLSSDFNPFATRCKIGNSPERELDRTLTLEKEDFDLELKEEESPFDSTLVLSPNNPTPEKSFNNVEAKIDVNANKFNNNTTSKMENNNPAAAVKQPVEPLSPPANEVLEQVSSLNKETLNMRNDSSRVASNMDTNRNITNMALSNNNEEELVMEHSFGPSANAATVNRRINRLSQKTSKNLSPMSKCGDLMGMSPSATPQTPVTHKPAIFREPNPAPSRDLITGRLSTGFGPNDNFDDEDFTTSSEHSPGLLSILSDNFFPFDSEPQPVHFGAGDSSEGMLALPSNVTPYPTTSNIPATPQPMKLLHQLVFEDPAALDFLVNRGSGNRGGREFCKESLLVRFDPLVGAQHGALPQGTRPSREPLSPVANHRQDDDTSPVQNNYLVESCSSDSSLSFAHSEGKTLSTMSSVDQSLSALTLQSVPPQSAANNSTPAQGGIPNVNVAGIQLSEKPTQVVTPAISTRQQYMPSTPLSSKTAPSPAKSVSSAIAAIDRLISLGGTPPPPPVVQPKEPDMDPRLLTELQSVKEMLGRQEDEVRQANDLVASLQKQLSESSGRENALIDRVNETSRDHRKMDIIMEEYERTMSHFFGEREAEQRQWAEERATLVRERDEANAHLANMEHSFNDIHTKYERCKSMVQGYKQNEEILKQTVASNEEASKKQLERYEQLRQHAMSQLEIANQEIDTVKKSNEKETTKLQAMLKKSEVQAVSLQESLAQKIKDIEELTAICDELINKVV